MDFSSLCRQNQTREQKDADVLRRFNKRAAEKEERATKKLAQENEDWICFLVNNLALDVPKKSEMKKARLESNAKYQASKREKETKERQQKIRSVAKPSSSSKPLSTTQTASNSQEPSVSTLFSTEKASQDLSSANSNAKKSSQ